jgi:hypothetical protein
MVDELAGLLLPLKGKHYVQERLENWKFGLQFGWVPAVDRTDTTTTHSPQESHKNLQVNRLTTVAVRNGPRRAL